MPTPSLRELQHLFWRALADDRPVAACAALVEPSARLDAEARVQVYADAYFWRLRDVLREDFPRVASVLGEDRFDALVRDYLRRHPSESPSVRHLGREMARFLEWRLDFPPCLADLAHLEWARIEAFDAPGGARATLDTLRGVSPCDWPHLHFIPIPALRVVRARWPVHEVWSGADAATVVPARTALRVWRGEEDRVFHAPMDARAAHALDLVAAGAPFVVMCAAFADLPPAEAAVQATGLLARWLEDGLIAEVR